MTDKRYIHISDLISLYTGESIFLDLPEPPTEKPEYALLSEHYEERQSVPFTKSVADRLHTVFKFLLHGEDDTFAIRASRDLRRAYLGDKYPFLEEISVPPWPTKRNMLLQKKELLWEARREQLIEFLYEMENKYGAWFEIEPLPNYHAPDPVEAMIMMGQDPTKLLSTSGRRIPFKNLRMEEVERLPQTEFFDLSAAILSLAKSSSPILPIRPEQFSQKIYADTKGEVIAIGLDTLNKEKADKTYQGLKRHFSNMGIPGLIDLHFDTSSLPHQYSIRIEAEEIVNNDEIKEMLTAYTQSRTNHTDLPPR